MIVYNYFIKKLVNIFPKDKDILYTVRALNLQGLSTKCIISEMFILITFYPYKLNLGKPEHYFSGLTVLSMLLL